jgi:hypothetical protein
LSKLTTVKVAERERARVLRRDDGLSVKHIARLLAVSPGTVSRWVRDIELTPEQRAVLRARNPIYDRQLAGSALLVTRGVARRRGYQNVGRARARTEDSGYAMGCMLYWAEGSKDRNSVRFSNSDPLMLALFLTFLRTYFAVPNSRVRLTCNLYADHRAQIARIESFWLDFLRLPDTCLLKSSVNVYSRWSMRKRRNRLPYGTCRLVVNSTEIAQTILGSIQEYGGFDRQEWLA